MREYSEYVENKFNDWINKYEIPEHMEFELKSLFDLEEQFRNQPPENVKTKDILLNMIMRINGRFNGKLFERKTKIVKPDIYVVIAVNSNAKELYQLFYHVFEEQIKHQYDYKEVKKIEIENYHIYIIDKKEEYVDMARGITCHYYINLTGDKYFEGQVLKPMLIK